MVSTRYEKGDAVKDLLGDEVIIPMNITRGKRKSAVPKGYAKLPGTGPHGETCRTCLHDFVSDTKRFHKCELCRPRWTHGRATDILARDAACALFAPKDTA
jgi:hypothetical protein